MKSTVSIWSGSSDCFQMSEVGNKTAEMCFNTMLATIGRANSKYSSISGVGTYIYSYHGSRGLSLSNLGVVNSLLGTVGNIGYE